MIILFINIIFDCHINKSIQKEAFKPQFLSFPLPPTYDKLPYQLKS